MNQSDQERLNALERRLEIIESALQTFSVLFAKAEPKAVGTLATTLRVLRPKLSRRLYNCIINHFEAIAGSGRDDRITLLQIVQAHEFAEAGPHKKVGVKKYGVKCQAELSRVLEEMGLKIAMTDREVQEFALKEESVTG